MNNRPLVSKRSALKLPGAWVPSENVLRATIEPELEITKELPFAFAALPMAMVVLFDQNEFAPLTTTLEPDAPVPFAITRLPAATKPFVRLTVAGPLPPTIIRALPVLLVQSSFPPAMKTIE